MHVVFYTIKTFASLLLVSNVCFFVFLEVLPLLKQWYILLRMNNSIEWKELYAIVVACKVWGKHWSGKRLLFDCDNDAVVHIWLSGHSHCPDLMDLERGLFFIVAYNNLNVMIRHIPCINNSIADALSRL